jgi:hypothetical protein
VWRPGVVDLDDRRRKTPPNGRVRQGQRWGPSAFAGRAVVLACLAEDAQFSLVLDKYPAVARASAAAGPRIEA